MAIENDYPPLLWTDSPQAEIAALREQVRQLTDHNRELLGVLTAVRAACAEGQIAARSRIAQGSPAAWAWAGKHEAYLEIAEIVKSVE